MEDTLEFSISRLKLLDCSNNKSATQWSIKLEQELNFLLDLITACFQYCIDEDLRLKINILILCSSLH